MNTKSFSQRSLYHTVSKAILIAGSSLLVVMSLAQVCAAAPAGGGGGGAAAAGGGAATGVAPASASTTGGPAAQGTNPNVGPGNGPPNNSQQFSANRPSTWPANPQAASSPVINNGVGVGATTTANTPFGQQKMGGAPVVQPTFNGLTPRNSSGNIVVPNSFAPQGTAGAPPPNTWRNPAPYGDSGNIANQPFSDRYHLTVPPESVTPPSAVGRSGLPLSIEANIRAMNNNNPSRDPNRFRFVNQNGNWWYWTPGNYWMYYRGNNWYRYNPNSNRAPTLLPDASARVQNSAVNAGVVTGAGPNAGPASGSTTTNTAVTTNPNNAQIANMNSSPAGTSNIAANGGASGNSAARQMAANPNGTSGPNGSNAVNPAQGTSAAAGANTSPAPESATISDYRR